MENTTPNREHTNNKKQKMSMADRFMTAILLPKEYDKLLRLSMGKLVQFLTVLILLIAVIRYAIPALGAIASMGGVKNIILNEIPEFSLDNGIFTLDEKLERSDEINGIYMIVDTSVEQYTKKDIPDNVVEAIMVSKTNMLFYNYVAGLGGIVEENKFEDFKELTINNGTVAKQSPLIYACLFFLFVIMLIFEIVKYLAAGLLYAVVMYLLAKTMLVEITFGKVYQITMYAQAAGAIVNAVMYCIDIPILILAGSSFAMLITVMLINRVLIQIKMQSGHL